MTTLPPDSTPGPSTDVHPPDISATKALRPLPVWEVVVRSAVDRRLRLVEARTEHHACCLGAVLLELGVGDVEARRLSPDLVQSTENVYSPDSHRHHVPLDKDTERWLEAICAACDGWPSTPGELVLHLVQSAAAGARRLGSWERHWLRQAIPLVREPGVPDPELPQYYRALPPAAVRP